MTNKYFWYTKEKLQKLNDSGYVHFVIGEKCNVNDFKEGDGFFYNEEDKTYGKSFILNTTKIETILDIKD